MRRRIGSAGAGWALLAIGLAAAPPASAIEAAGGRVQVHGFYEAQIRSIVRDFDFSDDWDLTQWWNILSIEIEADVAPDGWGPFDTVNVFGRIEVRYDCVWTRACSIFDSANAYGPHIGRLPKRLSDARRSGWAGTQWNGDISTSFVPATIGMMNPAIRPMS